MNLSAKLKEKPALRLSVSGLLVAMGVVLSAFHIQVGAAKCFPIQHLINVLSAVLLGPGYAVMTAFVISVIRNITGLGSLLAFPGSMIGAFLAAMAYRKWSSHRLACLGELLGTGIIGGLFASPFAILLMGKEVGIFFFVLPFVISSLSGSLIALSLFETSSLLSTVRKQRFGS